jgi:hypothetical protein
MQRLHETTQRIYVKQLDVVARVNKEFVRRNDREKLTNDSSSSEMEKSVDSKRISKRRADLADNRASMVCG